MPVIKKWLLVLVVIIAIASMVFLAGCHGIGRFGELLCQTKIVVKTSETTAEAKETVAESKVKGVIYETEKFSILQPDGWKATEVSSGVVFEKGGDIMQVGVGSIFATVDGVDTPFTEALVKKLIEDLAKAFNGTVEELTMFDAKFFKTSVTFEGRDTTFAYGFRNGEADLIVMGGKDHQNNVEIKAMLESIKFK